MAGAPQYRSQVDPQSGLTPFQPHTGQITPLPGDTGLADGLRALGGAVSGFAEFMKQVDGETEQARAKSNVYTRVAAARDDAMKSEDFTGAPQAFAAQRQKIVDEELGNVRDPVAREKLRAGFTEFGITQQRVVDQHQLGNQINFQTAALDRQLNTGLIDAGNAGSPAERASVLGRTNQAVDDAIAAGTISYTAGNTRKLQFVNSLDRLQVAKDAQADPAATAARLRDDKSYAGSLDPETRLQFQQRAEGTADQRSADYWKNVAAFRPWEATAAVGRVSSPAQGDDIFNRGIVQIESRGDNSAVSSAGALGASQILPGTARQVARDLGKADIANLSDADLRQRLLSDKPLNLELGQAYFRQQVSRYNGNIAVAASAYNAGPGNADRWVKAATEKFGPNFTADQYQSVVDVDETKAYIGKLGKALGAPLGSATFFNPHVGNATSDAIDSIATAERQRQQQLAARLASIADATDDVTSLLKRGLDVDPSRIAGYRAAQLTAANGGDQAAAGRLRELGQAETVAPFIRQAWQMNPTDLDGQVQSMRAQVFAPGANPTQQQVSALDAFDAVRKEQLARRDAEPVTLGGQNGARFYDLKPIDTSAAPADPSFLAGLSERNAQALAAQRRFGGSGSPFTRQETEGLRQRLETASTPEKFGLLKAMGGQFSPETYRAATKALGLDDPVTTFAVGLAQNDEALGRSILEGQAAIRTDPRYLPEKGVNKLTWLATKDSALPPAAFEARAGRADDNGPYAAMSAAVDARYAALSARAGDLSGQVNTNRLKQAANDVTGGVLYHNGPAIAPFRGASQGDFDGLLRGLTDADLASAHTLDGSVITADYLRGSAKLHAVGQGRYLVQTNRDDTNPLYAAGANGAFVLDLRNRQPPPATETLNPGLFGQPVIP